MHRMNLERKKKKGFSSLNFIMKTKLARKGKLTGKICPVGDTEQKMDEAF